MILEAPMMISARLLPAVSVGNAWLSIEPTGEVDHYGKPEWRWFLDLDDGTEHGATDLNGWGDAREMLGAMLDFLRACGESRSYRTHQGYGGENADLFPEPVGTWAEEHADEIAFLACHLREV